MSAQACFTPIPRSGEAAFTPFNPHCGSSRRGSAVLAIVATRSSRRRSWPWSSRAWSVSRMTCAVDVVGDQDDVRRGEARRRSAPRRAPARDPQVARGVHLGRLVCPRSPGTNPLLSIPTTRTSGRIRWSCAPRSRRASGRMFLTMTAMRSLSVSAYLGSVGERHRPHGPVPPARTHTRAEQPGAAHPNESPRRCSRFEQERIARLRTDSPTSGPNANGFSAFAHGAVRPTLIRSGCTVGDSHPRGLHTADGGPTGQRRTTRPPCRGASSGASSPPCSPSTS